MLLAYLDLYPDDGPAVRLHETSARAISDAAGLLGTTNPRGDVDDLPEADGAIEPQDMWMSYRTITLSCEVWASDLEAARIEFQAIDAALRSSLHAPLLMRWKPDNVGSPEMQGYVRLVGSVSPLIPFEDVWMWTAQLRAASPYWVSQTERSITVGAPSFTYGLETPLSTPIPNGADVGAATVECLNAGNEDAYPVITINGPVSGPVVENLATGDGLQFPGLVLATGQALVIDTSPLAVDQFAVNGDPTGAAPDWETATLPRLAAGTTETLKFYGLAGGYGASTSMSVAWRDTYI